MPSEIQSKIWCYRIKIRKKPLLMIDLADSPKTQTSSKRRGSSPKRLMIKMRINHNRMNLDHRHWDKWGSIVQTLSRVKFRRGETEKSTWRIRETRRVKIWRHNLRSFSKSKTWPKNNWAKIQLPIETECQCPPVRGAHQLLRLSWLSRTALPTSTKNNWQKWKPPKNNNPS